MRSSYFSNILDLISLYTIDDSFIPELDGDEIVPNYVEPTKDQCKIELHKIQEKLSQIKQKLVDIQDKLNALFGEAKAFVEKKVSELINSVK